MLLLPLLVMVATPVKIATSGFTLDGQSTAASQVWGERFAEVLRRNKGVQVTTSGDLQQLLGLERQKSLLGCDSNSCLAELASALGSDGVLAGSMTRSDSGFVVALKLLRTNNGQIWWSASTRVGSEGALLDWLDAQAEAVGELVAPGAPVRAGPLVLGGAGVVGLGVGAALVVVSNTAGVKAVREAADEPALSQALTSGKTTNLLGFVVGGVGVAAVAGAVIWAVAGSDAPAVAVLPTNGGAVVSLGGRW